MATNPTRHIDRAIAAGSAGVAAGSAISGLIALVTHLSFIPTSTWLSAVPALVLLGATCGAVIGGVTRWQLGNRWPRRVAQFSATGALLLPLLVATGLPWADRTLTTCLAFCGWLGTTALSLVRSRRQRRQRSNSHPDQH
jgi:membrane protein YqaA with SNARE-associated domain